MGQIHLVLLDKAHAQLPVHEALHQIPPVQLRQDAHAGTGVDMGDAPLAMQRIIGQEGTGLHHTVDVLLRIPEIEQLRHVRQHGSGQAFRGDPADAVPVIVNGVFDQQITLPQRVHLHSAVGGHSRFAISRANHVVAADELVNLAALIPGEFADLGAQFGDDGRCRFRGGDGRVFPGQVTLQNAGQAGVGVLGGAGGRPGLTKVEITPEPAGVGRRNAPFVLSQEEAPKAPRIIPYAKDDLPHALLLLQEYLPDLQAGSRLDLPGDGAVQVVRQQSVKGGMLSLAGQVCAGLLVQHGVVASAADVVGDVDADIAPGFDLAGHLAAVGIGFVQIGLVRGALHAPGEGVFQFPELQRNLFIVDDLQAYAGAVGVQAKAVAVLLRASVEPPCADHVTRVGLEPGGILRQGRQCQQQAKEHPQNASVHGRLRISRSPPRRGRAAPGRIHACSRFRPLPCAQGSS